MRARAAIVMTWQPSDCRSGVNGGSDCLEGFTYVGPKATVASTRSSMQAGELDELSL